MKKFWIILLFALLGSMAKSVQLSFRPLVQDFQANQVNLGDLANCSGSKEFCKKILTTEIGIAPPPGMDRIYVGALVLAALKLPDGVEVSIDTLAPKSHLWRAKLALDTANLKKELLSQVRARIPESDSLDLQVRLNGIPFLANSQQKWSFEWPTQAANLSRIPVKVLIQDGTGFRKDIQVQVMVRRWNRTPVSSRDLRIGEPLTPADWGLKMVEQGSSHPTYLDAAKIQEKWEISRAVRAGQILQLSQVRRPLIVKNGGNLTLVSKFGQARIEMIAESLQDGSVGELIKCKNPSTGKQILARLNEYGEGEVQQ